MRSKPYRAIGLLICTIVANFVVVSAAHSHSDGAIPMVQFPEYDARTACIENVLLPDAECIRREITTRALLLSGWPTIEVQYEASASNCIALLAHPDAAPRSYEKLLACIAGDLYAAE